MVHHSIGNNSRVADTLYLKRGCLVLEDFHFFSLYSFNCIAKKVTTLKQLRLLSCLNYQDTISKCICAIPDNTFLSPISPKSDPSHLNRTSPYTTYLILNVPTFQDMV